MDRWMDGQIDGWIDKWMDGQVDGWIDEWMIGQIDGWIYKTKENGIISIGLGVLPGKMLLVRIIENNKIDGQVK